MILERGVMIVTEKYYSKNPENLTVGIANIGSKPGKIEQNKKKITAALDLFAKKKCNLVVFPEYCLSGYFWELEIQCRTYMNQKGCLDQLKGWLDMLIARYVNETLQYIVFNSPQKSGKTNGNYFNTTIVLDRGGRFLEPCRSYRKSFLPGMEKQYIIPIQGDTLVLDTMWGEFGFLTCYDICYPHLFHELAHIKSVDGIIVTAAWRKQGKREYKELKIREDNYYQAQWDIMTQALASQNQAWVIAANAVGPHSIEGLDYCGSSGVWAPSGINMIKASDSKEELLILHNIDITCEVNAEKKEFWFTDDFKYGHKNAPS